MLRDEGLRIILYFCNIAIAYNQGDMKIVLEVKESKADLLLALLNDLPYVKVKPANEKSDNLFLTELQEAVEEVNLIKAGKRKGRPVEDLLNEL